MRKVCIVGAALLVAVILVVVAARPPDEPAQAQGGGSLGYGSKVFGKISGDTPTVTYSFNGTAGDIIQVSVKNWVGALDPQFDLVAPDNAIIASGTISRLSEDPADADLSLLLPQTGIYLLLVSGENSTTGDFWLVLSGRSAAIATPLLYGQGVDIDIPVDPQPQIFTFEAQSCPTTLTVANLSEGEPYTFPYSVKVNNPQGQIIAVLQGGDALEDRLTVAPLSGRYEVTVLSEDPHVAGRIHLLVSCADQTPGCIGASGDQAAGGAGTCLPCFSTESGPCAGFTMTANPPDGTAVTFSWPPFEGAQGYIFSISDAAGTMLMDSAVMLEGADTTTHSYPFRAEDLDRGPFTAIVSAWSEGEGNLCTAQAPVDFGTSDASACAGISVTPNVVPGDERRVVLEWTAVPGTAEYLIHIYALDPDDGSRIGIRVPSVPGDTNTYHVGADMLPGDYNGFEFRIEARDAGGTYLCSGSTTVELAPVEGPVHWGPGVGE